MRPEAVLASLERMGVELRVEDGRLVAYRPPDVAIPPDLAAAVRACKAELIALLSEAPPGLPAGGAVGTAPKTETEPAAFGAGREEVRKLANGIYALARKHGFPELEIFPGRKIGPGPEAWEEALRRPLEAGYESELWAVMFGLEEAVSPEEEKAYADRLLYLAQALGYPELEGDGRCPGPIRRIPAGAVGWAVAAATMDPAERRYWLERLKETSGAGQGH
jgi:hypothetical protein